MEFAAEELDGEIRERKMDPRIIETIDFPDIGLQYSIH
jgi:hypothetical protein